MKRRLLFIVLVVSAIFVLLFALGFEKNPFVTPILMPGFLFAVWINGSLHDRVILGFILMGILSNVIIYSCVAFGAQWLLRKLRGT